MTSGIRFRKRFHSASACALDGDAANCTVISDDDAGTICLAESGTIARVTGGVDDTLAAVLPGASKLAAEVGLVPADV